MFRKAIRNAKPIHSPFINTRLELSRSHIAHRGTQRDAANGRRELADEQPPGHARLDEPQIGALSAARSGAPALAPPHAARR